MKVFKCDGRYIAISEGVVRFARDHDCLGEIQAVARISHYVSLPKQVVFVEASEESVKIGIYSLGIDDCLFAPPIPRDNLPVGLHHFWSGEPSKGQPRVLKLLGEQ